MEYLIISELGVVEMHNYPLALELEALMSEERINALCPFTSCGDHCGGGDCS